jgi:hypothetical protein
METVCVRSIKGYIMHILDIDLVIKGMKTINDSL